MFFRLNKSCAQHMLFTVVIVLYIKVYFNSVHANFDSSYSGVSSISEVEKNRRRNVIKPFVEERRKIENDWLETYHHIFPEVSLKSNEMTEVKSSFAQDNLFCNSDTSTRKSSDISTRKIIENGKNFDEMQGFSELHSEKYENNWSNSKGNVRLTSKERNRRLSILISFKQHIPGLERGEYILEDDLPNLGFN